MQIVHDMAAVPVKDFMEEDGADDTLFTLYTDLSGARSCHRLNGVLASCCVILLLFVGLFSSQAGRGVHNPRTSVQSVAWRYFII